MSGTTPSRGMSRCASYPLLVLTGFCLSGFAFASEDLNYGGNLEKAKAFIQFQEQERLEDQLNLYASEVVVQSPQYGAQDLDFEGARDMLAEYHSIFDDMRFSDASWIPGVSESGSLDGSVSVFGTWTGRNVSSGAVVELNSYHKFEFNSEGKIISHEDYFDFGGMMAAAVMNHPVVVSLKVREGQLAAAISALDSPEGLPLTRDWPGCLSLTRFVHEATNTIWVIANWESYQAYGEYLDWRQSTDTFVSEKLNPLLEDVGDAVAIIQPNSFIKEF